MSAPAAVPYSYKKHDRYKHDILDIKEHAGKWWVWAGVSNAPLSYHRSERAAKRRRRKMLKRWNRLW